MKCRSTEPAVCVPFYQRVADRLKALPRAILSAVLLVFSTSASGQCPSVVSDRRGVVAVTLSGENRHPPLKTQSVL